MAKDIDEVLVKTVELVMVYNDLKIKHNAILERVELLVAENHDMKNTIRELKKEITELKFAPTKIN